MTRFTGDAPLRAFLCRRLADVRKSHDAVPTAVQPARVVK
jgi:hypothetical protein